MWDAWLVLLRARSGRDIAVKAAIFALAACLASAAVCATERNVYLIASEPTADFLGGFPTLLYRVDGGGLVKVRTITTQRQDTRFVDVYPELGYALVGSETSREGGSYLLDVISMGSVSRQKSYEINVCDGCSYISSHIQDRRDALAYVVRGYDYTKGRSYKGVDIKSGQTMSGFEWIDEANAYRNGDGSYFVDSPYAFGAVMHGNEVLEYGRESVRRHKLDWRLPEVKGLEPESTVMDVVVNNDDMRLVRLYPREWRDKIPGMGPYIFDKVAGEWSKLSMPGSGYGAYRAFGRWLAMADFQDYSPRSLDLERLRGQWFPPFPSAAERFEMKGYAPSGRLFLYNARTNALIVHDTGEPNSEVLHVDGDDAAWYRVSDELRRAPILGDRLGPPEVVAKGPELWPVHWLFFGKQ